ncbi:glutathione S-transferase [Alteromonadaceae bacterium Bs31]|nr:glutathione S-transferase [Alteromonadaceae bacterium Bs31]
MLAPAPAPAPTKDIPVLVSFPICPFVQRSAILLEHKQQRYERINIDLANKPDWFLALSPTGKVPALVINTGETEPSVLFESAIINEYLDETYGKPLLTGNSLSKAHSRAWIAYTEVLIMQQYALLLEQEEEAFQQKLEAFFIALNKLKPASGAPFFNGKAFSLVDAAIAPVFTRLRWLPQLREMLKEEALINEESAGLLAWIENLVNNTAVQASVASDFEQVFIEYFKDRNSVAIAQWEQQGL